MKGEALFPYQQIGAAFLAARGRALLADEMGLGKSAQAIAATQSACGAPDVAVVCPASVRQNWYREFERFWDGLVSYDLTVESYDKVARGALADRRFDVLILDEAHYLKTRTAKRTKAILGEKCDGVGGLVERAGHVFCLTGTPTPNNPSELWPLLRAVMPDAITDDKPMSWSRFIHRYCRLRDNGFALEIVGGRNLSELRERMAPFVLRRRKSEVLAELPPLRLEPLHLDADLVLPPEVLTVVRDVDTELDVNGIEGLASLIPHVATLRRLTGMAKAPKVAEWVCDWLDGCDGKIVVFVHHREVIDLLQGVFGANCVVVAGDTPVAKRQAAVDAFQCGSPRVFVGQLQAAGTGITLTAASDVVFAESSWVPAENEQAAMRVHRIGQRNACLVRFATLPGSIDERIQRAVMRKMADIKQLFG